MSKNDNKDFFIFITKNILKIIFSVNNLVTKTLRNDIKHNERSYQYA